MAARDMANRPISSPQAMALRDRLRQELTSIEPDQAVKRLSDELDADFRRLDADKSPLVRTR